MKRPLAGAARAAKRDSQRVPCQQAHRFGEGEDEGLDRPALARPASLHGPGQHGGATLKFGDAPARRAGRHQLTSARRA